MQVDWALKRRGVVMLVAGSRGGGLDGLQRALEKELIISTSTLSIIISTDRKSSRTHENH
jgi:hypothetical protein